MRTWSDKARVSASMARKIKHLLGQAAYDEYKRTGHIPSFPATSGELHQATPEESKPHRSIFDKLTFRGFTKNPAPLKALRLIDSVHKFSDTKFQHIEAKSGRDADRKNGSYRWTRDNKTGKFTFDIVINGAAPLTTMVHELGHAIDQQMLAEEPKMEASGFFSGTSRSNPAAGILHEAIQASRRVGRLKEQMVPGTKIEVVVRGEVRTLNPDRNYIADILQPHELFADAYTQWIFTRSGDAAELEKFRHTHASNAYSSRAWDEHDFELIGEAMDLVFEEYLQ